MKTGGGNFKAGGINTNSKFRRNIMQAAEEVVFSESKEPWDGYR